MTKNDPSARRLAPGRAWLGAVLLLGAASALPAVGLPTISIDPGSSVVSPGEEFDLVLRINADADTFSNFRVILRFDPAVLAFVEAVEGSLYVETGLPTWFHVEEESLGTWEIFDVLLHGRTYVVAPGELARVRFEALALGVSPVDYASAIVTDRDREPLDPLYWTNGIVFVDDITGVPGTSTHSWEIGPPVPNPSPGAVRFRIGAPVGGGRGGPAVVLDIRGRRVRELDSPARSGAGFTEWDGRDDRGEPAPPGVYFVRWPTPDGGVSRRVTLIR